MSLRPDGPVGPILVTGRDGTVIFEGEGQVLLNAEDTRDGLHPGMSVLRIREGNYHAQVDITGLMELGNVAVEVECVLVRPEPEDRAYLTCLPSVVRTHVHLNIPASMALAMRAEQFRLAPAFAGVGEAALRAARGLQEFRESLRLEANEELMADTRAQFPYDPHGYGYPEDGNEMRWTPPQAGEVIPSCPA